MNPRRPHPYQINDSHFSVCPSGTRWVVVETYDEVRVVGCRDSVTLELEWFDTREEAEADRDRRAGR